MDNKIPPLGLMPKHIWDSKRINDILSAMERYSEADKAIPVEWITELRTLLEDFS